MITDETREIPLWSGLPCLDKRAPHEIVAGFLWAAVGTVLVVIAGFPIGQWLHGLAS